MSKLEEKATRLRWSVNGDDVQMSVLDSVLETEQAHREASLNLLYNFLEML